MPVRATKRGAERTPIGGDFDVLICGASFAGLAVARELRATRARVLVLDRYEIGERQTSACAAPTEWLRNLGLEASIRQTFGSLLVHTPHADARWPLGVDVLHVRLPRAVRAAVGAARRVDGVRDGEGGGPRRHVNGGHRGRAHRPRRAFAPRSSSTRSGWKRILGSAQVQPPEARLSRGLEVHPGGTGDDLELWIDRAVIRAGYGWSFPAADELRVGVGSFDPHDHVKQPTVALADGLGLPPDGYQGNWIPHRAAAGDRGRRVLRGRHRGPLPAADRRGDPHRVLLRHRLRARAARGARGAALARGRRWSATAASRSRTAGSSSRCCRRSSAVPRLHPRALGAVARGFRRDVGRRTGRSGTTCGSRRRRSRCRRRRWRLARARGALAA